VSTYVVNGVAPIDDADVGSYGVRLISYTAMFSDAGFGFHVSVTWPGFGPEDVVRPVGCDGAVVSG